MSESTTCSWWHEDDCTDTWESSCGIYFNIIDGETPKDCHMAYCFSCGKPLQQVDDPVTKEGQEPMNLEREIVFTPAYDERAKDCGIHGAEMRWFLKGPEGAIQFVVYTSWHLPHVQAELDAKRPDSRSPYLFHKPLPADIGYHSKIPRYDGHEPIHKDCELTGGDCYYDGSGLNAEKGFNLLVEKGSDAVWEWMEEWYRDCLLTLPSEDQGE